MTIVLDDRFTVSLRAENILDICFERQQIRAKTFVPLSNFWGRGKVCFEFTKLTSLSFSKQLFNFKVIFMIIPESF